MIKGKTFVGRSRELEALHKSLRRGSDERALLVAGDKGMGKTALLERFWDDVRSSGSPALWISLGRLANIREPSEVSTALVESLDGSTSALQGRVAAFAQSFGRAIFATEQEVPSEEETLSKEQRLARLWTAEFLKAFPLDKESSGQPVIYVAIDDLDQVRSNLLGWFIEEFVSQWEEAGIFKSFRFLATSSKWPMEGAALRFIESIAGQEPLLVRLEPLNEQECSELARSRGLRNLSGSELLAKTNGIPSHVEDELEMHSVTSTPFSSAESGDGSLPEGLTDRQTQWIAHAACLPNLSAEGLSLFYDPKEASEAYNWLRYNPKLTQKMSGRTIGLQEGIRQAALNWFNRKDPAGTQAALNRVKRFNDFQARVPTEEERRALLLLSHYLFFDEEALEAVVGDKTEQYIDFVKRRSEWFVKTNHCFQMLPEYRDICQRFRELVGESASDLEMKQKISACWERKKQRNGQRKDLLLSEQAKSREELASVDSQVKSLESTRERILEPAAESLAGKGKKGPQVKIGTSMGFLILGIVVLALSLGMRDLFSVYHTAAGIFLTLAGFFWPMVTRESTAPAGAPGMDQFAVETQQRVLQFRLNGLGTRHSNIHEKMGTVHREINSLDEVLEEPYLLDS